MAISHVREKQQKHLVVWNRRWRQKRCEKMTFYWVESPYGFGLFCQCFCIFGEEHWWIWTFGWFTALILTSDAYGWWFLMARLSALMWKKWNLFSWSLTGKRRFLFVFNELWCLCNKLQISPGVFEEDGFYVKWFEFILKSFLISMRRPKNLAFRFVLLLKGTVDSEKTATHVDNMLTMVSVCGERAASELWSFGRLVFGCFVPATDTSLTVLSRSRVLYVSERARFD